MFRFLTFALLAVTISGTAYSNCYSQKSNLQQLDRNIGAFMFKHPTETAAAIGIIAGADAFLSKKYDEDTRNIIYTAAIFAAAYCVWNEKQMNSCAHVAGELTWAFNKRSSLINSYARSGCGTYD